MCEACGAKHQQLQGERTVTSLGGQAICGIIVALHTCGDDSQEFNKLCIVESLHSGGTI